MRAENTRMKSPLSLVPQPDDGVPVLHLVQAPSYRSRVTPLWHQAAMGISAPYSSALLKTADANCSAGQYAAAGLGGYVCVAPRTICASQSAQIASLQEEIAVLGTALIIAAIGIIVTAAVAKFSRRSGHGR
jgi:hypothetical protein